ncbi:PR-1-like protein, partial [Acephala macrosclerotiorum]
SPTDYQSTAIYHHAKHRANHSASALEWDDTLATYALATANTCVFAHDMTEGVGGYGQNLAAYGTSGDVSSLDKSTLVADAITNQWYYGEAANVPYGQDSPATSNVPEFLHFTAVVWEATTKVGCATVECAAGTIFSYASLYTVCDYSSEGNVLGTFIANV